jgi:hypothetical protein
LAGNPSGKQSLGTPRRWDDNIKMDLREVGCEDGKWMELTEDRGQWQALMLSALNLQVLLQGS